MSEYFAMGGHAVFVWSAYAVATVVMVAMLVVSLRALRRQQQAVRLLEEARGRRRGADAPAGAVAESGPGVAP